MQDSSYDWTTDKSSCYNYEGPDETIDADLIAYQLDSGSYNVYQLEVDTDEDTVTVVQFLQYWYCQKGTSFVCRDPATAGKDWNKDFVYLRNLPESVEKYSLLSKLAQDFTYAAMLYSKLIISEVDTLLRGNLPLSLCCQQNWRLFYQTIKWVELLEGQSTNATGFCLRYDWIVNKFSLRVQFALDKDGLYGSDEYAMKAAGNLFIRFMV